MTFEAISPMTADSVHATIIEKRDPTGRLLARVGMANGRLHGPCIVYAADGETVQSESLFRDGHLVLPAAAPAVIRSPVASGDSLF